MNVAGAELDGVPEQVVQIHEDSKHGSAARASGL